MKILTNDEIKSIEKSTIESQGITTAELIERVAIAVAAEVKRVANPDAPLLVLAGWGGNGADALETARMLTLDGFKPIVYLFNIGGNKLTPACAIMRDRLAETEGATLYEVTGAEPYAWPETPSNATIIDGLFGSGLNRPLPRTFQLLARNITESGALVISIDVPSGLFSEWNGAASRQDMMQAGLTLAIEFPRLAFMFAENADVVGTWRTIKVGYDPKAIKAAPFSFVYIDKAMVVKNLTPRSRFASKATYGNAIIYAGAQGMAGASILAAEGALRAGAGRLTVHGPSCNCPVVQTGVPCAVFQSDKNQTHITSMPYDNRFNACAVGPGIGTDSHTRDALELFLKATSAASRRVIIDADALNIIAQNPMMLNYITPLSIITPHAGEFDRIFGQCTSDEERLKKAIKAAEDYNLIIVLKGHHTSVVRPDGKIMFNSTGTPALATPGSGDVLTGVITGLMATGMISEIAAFVGVYIHGLAGQIAQRTHGQYGVTAADVAACVGMAIKETIERG